MLKNRFGAVMVAALGLFAFVGCGTVLNNTDDGEYGSLTVADDSSRAIEVSSVKYAKVTVTGTGITDDTLTTTVAVSSGKASGITIDKIPTGKNRIVTVQGLDSSKNEISGALMRAVKDIVKGSNLCSVTWETSKKGYVYDALHKANTDIKSLSDDQVSEIDAAIPTCDASNINLSLFVQDYAAGSLGDKSKYVLDGTRTLTRLTVAESDSSAAEAPEFTATAYYSDGTHDDVTASATWTSSVTTVATISKGSVKLLAAGETVITGKYTYGENTKTGATQTVTVSAAGADLTGKTILFVKASAAPKLWAWETTGSRVELTKAMGYTWESQPTMIAATTEYMSSVSGWYMFDMSEKATGGNITFILNSGSDIVTGLSGCIWYDGSSSSNTNPSPTATGKLTSTITAGPVTDKEAPTIKCSAKSGDSIRIDGYITFTVTSNNCDLDSATAKVNGKSFTLNVGTTKVTLEEAGITTATTFTVSATAENSEGTAKLSEFSCKSTEPVEVTDTFTWDNAMVYFVIQDRFYDGDSSNNNSYGRMSKDDLGKNVGTFHGGDFKGLTSKLDYINSLGVNAIWVTAPYQQALGWCSGGSGDFAHYAYHGYYPLDYTEIDKNMGTVEEFRTFVTECHKRGIRVVMDVVMNHTGYLTLQDCQEYSINVFSGTYSGGKSTDMGFKIGPDGTSYSKIHDKIDYTGSSGWADWWGSTWVRAGVHGYTTDSTSELTMNLNSLPDVKTESDTAQTIAPILKTKWAKETSGYEDWIIPAASSLRSTSASYAPAVWIEKWLAAWVEEFGIDGFRCDTAKHVDIRRWAELKNLCKTALKTWRSSSRADDYAKDWTDDFWMTGEAFDASHVAGDSSNSSYYNNGFDSMIDLTCASASGKKTYSPSLPDWSKRAGILNGTTEDGNNALLYISSHDTGLGRWDDMKSLGTQFLLMPGQIQVMYGDEYGRTFGETLSDENQGTRSDFDWSQSTSETVKHWSKVGQFRRYNPAVGAGTISSDTRTYNGSAGANQVVISTSSKTVSVPYSDGTTVYNWYDGTSASVSGGKVTFSDSSASVDAPVLCSDRNPADYGVTY